MDIIDKTYGKAYASFMKTVSATYARAHFYDLVDEVSESGKRVAITKKGQIKAILVSAKEYDAWRTMAAKFISEA